MGARRPLTAALTADGYLPRRRHLFTRLRRLGNRLPTLTPFDRGMVLQRSGRLLTTDAVS